MSRNPPSHSPARRARAEARAARSSKARRADALGGARLPDAATLALWRAEMIATRGWGALITPEGAKMCARQGGWRFGVDMTTCSDTEVAELWRRARYELDHPAPDSFQALTRLYGGADAARRALALDGVARGMFVPPHLMTRLEADEAGRAALARARAAREEPVFTRP